MKYFHELSKEELQLLLLQRRNWDYVRKHYKQPKWCKYPNALDGKNGCWSLTDISEGRSCVTCENDCKNCECYKPVKKEEE